MALQYHCQNARRLAAIVSGTTTLQAIDYVEVLDTRDDILPADAQFTLLIVGTVDWGANYTTANVSFTGGARITGIEAAHVHPLTDWTSAYPSGFSTEEGAELHRRALLTSPSPARVLVVRVDKRGDFSQYTLTLTLPSGATHTLDTALSRVEFSFKAGCESPLDCEEEEEPCAETTTTAPSLDYLSRDYASFRQLMLDRLAVTLPGWKEQSPADLGMTVVELVAYVADRLAYYQDAVATEAYLETARKRVSVRRHARLLDYRMHDGCNARAWVVASVDADVSVPVGTPFYTRLDGYGAVIDPEEQEEALLLDPEIFESMHEVDFHEARNEIALYTWYDEECCLPKGATRATIRFATGVSTSVVPAAGDVLILEQVINPDGDIGVDRLKRQAVRLTAVTATSEPLDSSGDLYYDLVWAREDALTFAARLGEHGENYVFRGNVVLVDHGASQDGDALEPAAVTTPYRPRLSDTDLAFAVPYDHEEALTQSASTTMEQDPREALPLVTLTETDETDLWEARRDLLSTDAYTREFVVETEEDGVAWLRFGDGESGMHPEETATLTANWRRGGGIAGNVGAEAITHAYAASGLEGITALRNPLPAVGGVDPEPLADVRRFAPTAFRSLRRAVTAADYETVLLAHPEVQRAAATLRWTGSWHTAYVAVDRIAQEVDDDFLDEIAEYLEPYRMMGVDLELRAPRHVGLDIVLTLCVAEDRARDEVHDELVRLFSARDNADGTRGYFHPDNHTFGGILYLSEIVAKVAGVQGVQQVFTTTNDEALVERFASADQALRFRRFGEDDNGELAAGRLELGTFEILRVENDPADPERGVIRFNLLGGR